MCKQLKTFKLQKWTISPREEAAVQPWLCCWSLPRKNHLAALGHSYSICQSQINNIHWVATRHEDPKWGSEVSESKALLTKNSGSSWAALRPRAGNSSQKTEQLPVSGEVNIWNRRRKLTCLWLNHQDLYLGAGGNCFQSSMWNWLFSLGGWKNPFALFTSHCLHWILSCRKYVEILGVVCYPAFV